MDPLKDTFFCLWSDTFLWIIVICLALFLWKTLSNTQDRLLWAHVFSKPLCLIAVLVFGTFVGVALLDSVHLKTSSEKIYSILDFILKTDLDQTEETYSAPFSLFSLSTVAQLKEDGSIERIHPRLLYAGTHLKDPGDKIPDILQKTIPICAFFLLAASLLYKMAKKFKKSTLILLSYFLILFCIILLCTRLHPYYHLLGTSQIGQDVFYEMLKGIRTGLIIGTVTSLFMLPFALLLGMVASVFRGWVDDVIQYIYTTLSAIPGVLLIGASILSLQVFMENHPDWFSYLETRADIHLLALCAILGITSWTTLCRLIRAETLKLVQVEFLQAAKVLGLSTFSILRRHLMPNLMHIVVVTIAMDFSSLVLAEAVLSYVGVGVDPSSYSWGMMINGARLELARDPIVWWDLAAAFSAMLLVVLAANIISEGIRDIYDHKGLFR